MHTASKISVRTITMTALLSAIAYILAFVEFPVPLSPPFARMDALLLLRYVEDCLLWCFRKGVNC